MLKALTACLGHGSVQSLNGAAARCTAGGKLAQQVDDNVDSFQKSRSFICSCSQKLGVNVLVGFENCVIFDVIARVRKDKETGKGPAMPTDNSEAQKTRQWQPNSHSSQSSRCSSPAGFRPASFYLLLTGLFLHIYFNTSMKSSTHSFYQRLNAYYVLGITLDREQANRSPWLMEFAFYWGRSLGEGSRGTGGNHSKQESDRRDSHEENAVEPARAQKELCGISSVPQAPPKAPSCVPNTHLKPLLDCHL